MTAERRKDSRPRTSAAQPAEQQPRRAAPARPAEERAPDEVDEASRESFPASDAPSWTPLHAGRPRKKKNGGR